MLTTADVVSVGFELGITELIATADEETVVVSGAAGAVGTVVGQVAKIKGCRVVGIAGGTDKPPKFKLGLARRA